MERFKLSIQLILILNTVKLIQSINVSTIKFKLSNSSINYNYESIRLNSTLDFVSSDERILQAVTTSLTNYCLTHTTREHKCYSSTEHLDLSENNFNKIPNSLISKWFTNLKQLNMSYNHVNNLSLTESTSLERLDLSHNHLTTIESDTFQKLKQLKYLNLANNKLQNINPFAFADDTRYLAELNLSNNYLNDNSIEFLLFASLTNLKSLYLDNNKLTMFSHHLLLNLYSLEYLSLKQNNLISFEVFKLSKNNIFVKYLDLSFNKNLKIQSDSISSEINSDDQIYTNELDTVNYQLEHFNLAGIDLSSNTDLFLNRLFDRFKLIKILNMSQTNIKSLWSLKWPNTIETIDLSYNLIKNDQFDCRQLISSAQLTNKELKLKNIYLNNNQLTNFKKFIENCSPLMNKFTSLKIDTRYNLFSNLETVHSSLTNKKSAQFEYKCKNSPNKSSIFLHGNPLVCDCETNNWWSNIGTTSTPTLFYINDDLCLNIDDFESLECSSPQIDSRDQLAIFNPIRNYLIGPILVCPYRYSCSAKTCQCCGFRACDCSYQCPSSCKCTRDFAHTYDMVNCSNVSMNTIPNYLPISTSELLLQKNKLKKIQSFQFFGRYRLLNIDLSFNQIGFIEESSFSGLNQLKSLNLSFNSLQILLGYEFKELAQLEQLSLEQNQIQFISNLTFSYLTKLKYINLRFNLLRHTLEHKIFFSFNLNLVNLTFDMFNSDTSLYSNELKNLIANSSSSKDSDANKDYYYSDYYDNDQDDDDSELNSATTTSTAVTLNENLENLIGNLLNSDKTVKMSKLSVKLLTDCIIEKFKSFNDNKENSREILLIRNFKRFKTNCLRTINSNENDEIITSSEESRIGLFKKENSKYSALHLAKSNSQQSFIILNYNTILLGSIAFVILLVVFSSFIGILIIKLQRTKQKNLMLKKETNDYCKMKPLQHIFTILRRFLFGNQKENKVIYQQPVKKVKMYSHPQEDEEISTKFNFDIFIVYNKLDSDLVHNIIAPILRSKPYDFSVALQHCFYKTESSESTINSIKTTITTTTDQCPSLTSSFYSLSCDSSFNSDDLNCSLIKSSSLVLFVLSKNLLTEFEYNLSVRTPKHKKLAILADDINPDIAESILKPKKILRGKFDLDKMTFNFYCANTNSLNDEYDFMDEIRCSQRNSENNSMSSVLIQKDEIYGRNIKILNKRIQF